ncbi:MAG: TolC family protein [Proteobacteria bacterium]|nr:TolC family protein [Pseudomonadota bacterium]
MYRCRSCVLSMTLTYAVLAAGPLHAADTQPVPDPLSLQQAISLIDEQHPVLLQDKLLLERAKNTANEAREHNSLSVDLVGRVHWYEAGNSRFDVGDHDDHGLRLVVSKPLYDGGYSGSLAESAEQGRKAAKLRIAENRSLYTITVMQKFFDVILADLEASRDNEDMAVRFVRFEDGQDGHELGKISDVELLALENEYQQARLRMVESRGRASSARQALALALNRPGQQPSALSLPKLNVHDRTLLEFDILVEKALKNNRQLAALDSELLSARAEVEVARAPYRPDVSAVVERSEYSRDLGSHDKWRAGLQMTWPLFSGGQSDVATSKAQLKVNQILYQRRQLELDIRQKIWDMVEEFVLLEAQRRASDVFSSYRELYMDRSRALYELEVKTDLGDAMIQISESQLRDVRQTFQMTLLLAQLNHLIGEEDSMNWSAVTEKIDIQPQAVQQAREHVQ